MAELRSFPFLRHLRSEASSHILHFRRSRLVRQGRGLAFWFLPMSDSLAEIPADDRELPVMLHGRSSDFQDITAQGVLFGDGIEANRVAFPWGLRATLGLAQERLNLI